MTTLEISIGNSNRGYTHVTAELGPRGGWSITYHRGDIGRRAILAYLRAVPEAVLASDGHDWILPGNNRDACEIAWFVVSR